MGVPDRPPGDWALAFSDKRFRGMQWLSPTPRDYSLVNIRTGASKSLVQGHEGSFTFAGRLAHQDREWCWVETRVTELPGTNPGPRALSSRTTTTCV